MISRNYFIDDMIIKFFESNKQKFILNSLFGYAQFYFGCVYDIMEEYNMSLHIIREPVFKLNNDIIKYDDGNIVIDEYGIHIKYDDDTYKSNTNTFIFDIELKEDYDEDEEREKFFLKSLEDFENRLDKDKDIYFNSIYIEQTTEYFKASFIYCQIQELL